MSKKRTYKIPIEIYNCIVYVVLSGDLVKTGSAICKNKNWSYEESEDESQDEAVFLYSESDSTEYYVLFNFNPSTRTILHEVNHCTFTILKHHGVRLSDESEEAFTYLSDFICSKILHKLGL